MEKNIERDLINYLFFELNKQRFLIQDEIFEYDIQAILHEYLKLKFNNSAFKVKREKRKIDHVIEPAFEGANKNITYLELKSFIKNKETLNFNKITADIEKLNKISNNNIDSYFILVAKESHLKSKSIESKNLINCLNTNQKFFTFLIGNNKIKTRVLKSFKTIYVEKGNKTDDSIILNLHKSQIRVFMFQLISKQKTITNGTIQ